MKVRRIFHKFKTVIQLGIAAIATTPAALAQTTMDMSGITNIVMAVLPLLIVIVVIKALMDAFKRMT